MGDVRIGIIFPQAETAGDVGFAKEFSVAAEDLGFSHMLIYEHVLGADPAHHTLTGPYTHKSPFWEPFVFLSHIAALTSTIELQLGVLVLPMRQTALVAKQAATLDLLSNERFTLGVGVGWNQVEYAALGHDFATRGRRIEEQIPLLHRLWTEELITHQGDFDSIHHAGILPLPNRRIPIWMGGWADAVLERLGRLGDGWMTSGGSLRTASQPGRIHTPDDLKRRFAIITEAAEAAGRDPAGIGLSVSVSAIGREGEPAPFDPGAWAARAMGWGDAGATQVVFSADNLGFSPAEHLRAAEQLAKAAGL